MTSHKLKKYSRLFYKRNTIEVAKRLLGQYLVHKKNNIEYIGKIVEVEAYLGQHDLACHSSKGLTKRTKVLYGPAGYAYIYLIYGMYHCMNVVTEGEGIGSAVLIRAIEPIQNLDNVRTQGPGLLCRAMKIDLSLNAHDLLSDNFFIAKGESKKQEIVTTTRVGVDYAGEWAKKPLRFYLKNNHYISKK